MREIDTIVIHCAATPNGKHFTIEDIDRWHVENGWRRGKMRYAHRPHLLAVGYHEVGYIDGTIASGRHHDEVGAHAAMHNAHSLGYCMIGTDKFTLKEWEALKLWHDSVLAIHPHAKTVGHTDLPGVTKTCPGFSVAEWLAGGRKPLEGHII